MTPDFDIGKYFKERIGHYAETPPDGVWEKIATQLPYAGTPQRGNSHGVRFYYYAAGLFVAGLVALIIFLPRPQNLEETKPVSTQVVLNNQPVSEQPSTPHEQNPGSVPSNPIIPKDLKINAHLPVTPKSGMNTVVPQTGVSQHEGKTQPMSFSGAQALPEPTPPVANPKIQPSPAQQEKEPGTVVSAPHSSADTVDVYSENQSMNNETVLLTEQTITACKGEELTLSAGEGTGYRWNTGHNGQTITYSPSDETQLVVEYTDLKGRKVTSYFNIALLNCSVYVPKAFSPNDDGHNDYYRVKAEGINNFEMKIFSKWGELVFQTRDPEAGWDGKQKGNPAPAGVYIYQINYTDPNNQTRAIFGTLTLLR